MIQLNVKDAFIANIVEILEQENTSYQSKNNQAFQIIYLQDILRKNDMQLDLRAPR